MRLSALLQSLPRQWQQTPRHHKLMAAAVAAAVPTAFWCAQSAAPAAPTPTAVAAYPWAVEGLAFGLELETSMSVRDGKRVLAQVNVPQQRIWGRKYSGWKVVRDGGAEFVGPKMLPEDLPQALKVVDAIRRAKGKTEGRYCGLHIHLDATQLDHHGLLHLIDLFYQSERVLHRISDSGEERIRAYCQPVDAAFLRRLAERRPSSVAEVVQLWDESGCGRYYGLNLRALHKHNTVEVRLFRASLDPQYIEQSVALSHRLMGTARARGSFTNWEHFAHPAAPSTHAPRVLDALGFATSQQGLAQMRAALLQAHACHPDLVDLWHPAHQRTPGEHRAILEARAQRRKMQQVSTHQETFAAAQRHPFSAACARGDTIAVQAFLETATPKNIRHVLKSDNHLAFRAAALGAHTPVMQILVDCGVRHLQSEDVDSMCAVNNFMLLDTDSLQVVQLLRAWSRRSPRFAAGLRCAEGAGARISPQLAMEAYDEAAAHMLNVI